MVKKFSFDPRWLKYPRHPVAAQDAKAVTGHSGGATPAHSQQGGAQRPVGPQYSTPALTAPEAPSGEGRQYSNVSSPVPQPRDWWQRRDSQASNQQPQYQQSPVSSPLSVPFTSPSSRRPSYPFGITNSCSSSGTFDGRPAARDTESDLANSRTPAEQTKSCYKAKIIPMLAKPLSEQQKEERRRAKQARK